LATIEFLPDRLNREPAVFRGLTTSELFISFISGFTCGALLGIVPAAAFDSWALIPTGALVLSALSILLSGKYFARLKRGKPDTWLYRAMGAWLARHGMGNTCLVQTDGIWTIRRSET
jgi:conjugative transfer region protein (TIGR03750 family)